MNRASFVQHTASLLYEELDEAWQEEYAEQAKPEEMNDQDYADGLQLFWLEVLVKVQQAMTNNRRSLLNREPANEKPADSKPAT